MKIIRKFNDMIHPSVARIYTTQENKLVTDVISNMVANLLAYPCEINISVNDVCAGASFMLVTPSTRFTAAIKLIPKLSDGAKLVHSACIQYMPSRSFSTLSYEQTYFAFLFRMCHAEYLARSGDEDGFIKYLNENEKVRRVIRPKYGNKLAPLMKHNTKIFIETKKHLL